MSLKLNKNQIEQIIQLINWLITEIKFCQNSTSEIVASCCKQSNFKNLSFLKTTEANLKTMPFPLAWENAIENWQCGLKRDDKNLLKSLSHVLGAFDATGQITALEHANMRFEQSFKNAEITCQKQSKMAQSLGILLGLAICIILI